MSSVVVSMRHAQITGDCIPCAALRQCIGPERALPQRRSRRHCGRTRAHRLDVQAIRHRPLSPHRTGSSLQRRQRPHDRVGQASVELGLCRGCSRFARPARREDGVRARQRGQRRHARDRCGGRARLPQCAAVRASQYPGADRPQPWRLDDDARRAGQLRSRGARAQGGRGVLPIVLAAVRSQRCHPAADPDRRQGRLDPGQRLPPAAGGGLRPSRPRAGRLLSQRLPQLRQPRAGSHHHRGQRQEPSPGLRSPGRA